MPFLAFCTLRWFVVGHWGLVSFGGYNIVGITGQFLDEQLAEELPAEIQPLAKDILTRRAAIEGFHAEADFLSMERFYNDIIWKVSLPAATSRYGDDRVALNRAMTQLSVEVIKRRPSRYGQWLFRNAKHAVGQAHLLLLLDRSCVLMFVILLASHFASLWMGPPKIARSQSSIEWQTDFVERHLLIWTAIGFLVAKTALVIIVEPAIDRYMSGAIVFVPSAIAVLVARHVERIRRECCC